MIASMITIDPSMDLNSEEGRLVLSKVEVLLLLGVLWKTKGLDLAANFDFKGRIRQRPPPKGEP
jgi:hypothetical protein